MKNIINAFKRRLIVIALILSFIIPTISVLPAHAGGIGGFILLCILIDDACGGPEKREKAFNKGDSAISYATIEDGVNYVKNHRDEFSLDLNSFTDNQYVVGLPGMPIDSGNNSRVAVSSRSKARLREGERGQTIPLYAGRQTILARSAIKYKCPDISQFKTWQKGDLLFIRGARGWASQLLKHVSAWTHVGMVFNPAQGITYESLQEKGVNLYTYSDHWKDASSFSRRKVRISTLMIASAIDNSYQSLVVSRGSDHIPYWPKVSKSLDYMRIWSDKNDSRSMYCSKLVWKTFRTWGETDLDSNITCSYSMGQRDGLNPRAWIGVSPDDVYASRALGDEYNLLGKENLTIPVGNVL